MQQESCPTRLLEHRVIGKQKRAAKDKREHLSAAKEVEQGAWRVPGPGRGLRTEARISPASWLVARMEQKGVHRWSVAPGSEQFSSPGACRRQSPGDIRQQERTDMGLRPERTEGTCQAPSSSWATLPCCWFRQERLLKPQNREKGKKGRIKHFVKNIPHS